jgi:preprotein translocase subunit YajC
MFYLFLLANGQPAAPAEGAQPNIFQSFLVPMIIIMGVFFFITWRSNRKRDQERLALIMALKENDKIINSGGIVGVVASVDKKEDEVVLRGGLKITKSSIIRVIKEDSAKD